MSKSSRKLLNLALISLTSVGCFHRQRTRSALPPPRPLVTIADTPTSAPPLIPEIPLEPLSMPEMRTPDKKIKTRRKKDNVIDIPTASEGLGTSPEPFTPSIPTANVGRLSDGKDTGALKILEARQIITELNYKIAHLSLSYLEAHHEGIARARRFRDKAQSSIDSGDGEGAVILAVKARIILADLTE